MLSNQALRNFLASLFGIGLALVMNPVGAGALDERIPPGESAGIPSSGTTVMLLEPETPASRFLLGVTLPDQVPEALVAAHRFRSVRINPQAITPDALAEGDTLYLDLFDDVRLWATVDRISNDVNGVRTIRGRIQDSKLGSIVISIGAGRILARIDMPELQQEYVISDFGAGIGHVVQDVDLDRKDALEPGPALLPPIDELESGRTAGAPLAGAAADAPVTVDLMVVYTSAARQWADTNATSIDHVINQALALGQLALDNSQIGMTLNLVHAAEVQYTESGNSEIDLNRLTFHTGYDPWYYEGEPRYMDEVQGWRNLYRADLVTLFARVEDVGGFGWILNKTEGWPELGFQIVRVQQAHTGYTHIHEIGHNMGAHHHKAQLYQPGPGLYPYSAGWRWTSEDMGRYSSVMTYESGTYFLDGLTHVGVPYFSSPNLNYLGPATGDAADGDNARTLVGTKAAIAEYRSLGVPDFVVTAIALSPSSPTAGGTFNASVTVKNQGTASATGGYLSIWRNQATVLDCGATGYQKRTTVGTLAAGASTTLTFTGLSAGTAGTRIFRAFVDSACGTAESDESNNQDTLSYTVSPATISDFLVTGIALAPTSPAPGDTLSASVTVKNQGTASASGGYLSVWTNQATAPGCGATGYEKRKFVATLSAGASSTLTFTGLSAGTVGTKTFRAFVDSTCTKAESDESNNQGTLSYTVAPTVGSDFVVTAIALSPASPTADGTLDVAVTVTNQGTAAASGGYLSVWTNRSTAASCGLYGNKRQTVGTLAGGASKTLAFNAVSAGTAGTKIFRAFVDSACATAEKDESNNQMTKSYTVQ